MLMFFFSFSVCYWPCLFFICLLLHVFPSAKIYYYYIEFLIFWTFAPLSKFLMILWYRICPHIFFQFYIFCKFHVCIFIFKYFFFSFKLCVVFLSTTILFVSSFFLFYICRRLILLFSEGFFWNTSISFQDFHARIFIS